MRYETRSCRDGMFRDVGKASFVDNDDILNRSAVNRLYRAGIVTGVARNGSSEFRPTHTIDRTSVAAILTRMALPELRKG